MDPLVFISAGVACHAISLLNHLGLIDRILKEGKIKENLTSSPSNALALEKAILTLEKTGILLKKNDAYHITNFGKEVLSHMGSIGLIYEGYRSVIANQEKFFSKKINASNRFINGKAVAEASRELKKIHSQHGTVCDLGCGSGTKLLDICKKTRLKGIGIEVNAKAIEFGNSLLNEESAKIIQIEKDDIISIKKRRPNVGILLQCFVMHDIPTKTCTRVMNSYLQKFPNLEVFFYVDNVSPSAACPGMLPGFDYVHGLLGIRTRTYEETLQMFEQSHYKVRKEIPAHGIPNTFVWILEKKNKKSPCRGTPIIPPTSS